MTARSERLSWLLVEGIVIVVSILLAFTLDAAWDQWQERSKRDEYIAVLRSEFISALTEIEYQEAQHKGQVDAIREILATVDTRQEVPTDRFYELISLYVYGPSHPVYNDLANASSVEMLESDALRSQLFRYGYLRDFLGIQADLEAGFTQDHILPFLIDHVDLAVTIPPGSGQTSVTHPHDHEAFHTREFHNLLVWKLQSIEYQLGLDRAIGQTVREILKETGGDALTSGDQAVSIPG